MQEKIRGKARIAEELGEGKCVFFLKNANKIIIMDVCSSSKKKDD